MSHSDGRTFIGNWVGGLRSFHDLNGKKVMTMENNKINGKQL